MTPELAKALNELAITLLGLITTAVIPWLFTLIRSYAKARVDAIKNKDTRAALEFALTRLDSTAETVVTELNQTVKELSADGKLSKEDAKTLLKRAYSRVVTRLPGDATATLQSAFAERMQAVIVGKIEAKVAGAK
jgi:hypothetical protein